MKKRYVFLTESSLKNQAEDVRITETATSSYNGIKLPYASVVVNFATKSGIILGTVFNL